jgi:hypothetical protein
VRPLAAEVVCAARRLARRRSAAATLLVAALLAAYAALLRPVECARDAVSAATAIASFSLLVAGAGIVSDDRERGRLALVATHPAASPTWVLGRWLAVWAGAVAVLAGASAALLAVAGGGHPGRTAAALAASAVHLGALAALAVALSCRVGATAQVLILVALLVAGAVPPDVAAAAAPRPWVPAAARALWSALPTPWAVGRLHAWALSGGPAAPLLAIVLVLQPALWLLAGARSLGRAELGAREG